jgi:hypothetical protein
MSAAAVDGMTARARATVAELLELRGQPIILIPATAVATEAPSGGYNYSPAAARDPQVFAKFNTKALDGSEDSQTDRGQNRKFQFRMIGAYDTVIALGDSWEDDQASYTVETIDLTQPYQITAIVTAYLKVPGHSFG